MIFTQFAALLVVLCLYGSLADETNIHTDFVNPDNGSTAVENNHHLDLNGDLIDENNDDDITDNDNDEGIDIGERELYIEVTIKSKLCTKFLSDLKNAYEASQNFALNYGNNTNNSVEIDRFINPLNSFYDQFRNVTFTSANQIASAFNRGANYLQEAIRNGWKLHHDAVARGNYAMASKISGLLKGLQSLYTLGKGLNVYVSISGGAGGGFETGSTSTIVPV